MSDMNVRVCARFRPLNSKEIARGDSDVWEYKDEETLGITTSDGKPLKFNFDRIFKPDCTQEEVFDYVARPVIEDIFRGYNGTLFVYGQTGSGKTHTMSGPDLDDPDLRGIIPRMNDTVFEAVMAAPENDEFLLHASYVEIYMEKLRDLLVPSKNNLAVREDKQKGIYIEGCTDAPIACPEDVLDVMKTGNSNRMTASTNMNATSSRSHSLFILTVQKRDTGDNSLKTGKLYLVDLAGSEKVGKTGATGQTLEEAKEINKSLSALGNVINALTESSKAHIPYRDSKLTRVLQESLGGNAKTTLIVNCSPARYNEQESISTLRFGTRAKKIENKAKVNQIRSAKELEAELERAYKEVERLKRTNERLEDEVAVLQGMDPEKRRAMAAAAASAPVGFDSSTAPADMTSRYVLLEEKLRTAEARVAELEDKNEVMSDEITAKDDEILTLQSTRSELQQAQEKLQITQEENDELVLRIAKLTVDNDAARYKIEELESGSTNADAARSAAAHWEEERMELEREIRRLRFEAGEEDNTATEVTLPYGAEGSRDVTEPDEGGWSQDTSRVEKALSGNTATETSSPASAQTMAAIIAQNKGKGRRELLQLVAQQQKDVERLRREKTMMQQSLDEVLSETSQQASAGANANGVEDNEFDKLKQALVRDLDNRVQKVVELEMCLNEAREQYVVLLEQLRPAGSESVRTLQAKVGALQKVAAQTSQAHQRSAAENQQLRLDNQVYAKQLISRNERIHGLEQLLNESEAHVRKIQEEASRQSQLSAARSARAGSFAMRTSIDQNGRATGSQFARVARPLRGGGGGGAPTQGFAASKAAVSAASAPDNVNREAGRPAAASAANTAFSPPVSSSSQTRAVQGAGTAEVDRSADHFVPAAPPARGESPREAGREMASQGIPKSSSAGYKSSATPDKKSIWDMFRSTRNTPDGSSPTAKSSPGGK